MEVDEDWIKSIEIQGTDEHLERVHSFKHLGIIISEQLNWSDHFDYIQKKVSSRLSILRRIRHLLPIKTRKLIYNSLILPLLDYGDIMLGDRCNKALMDKLQVLQHIAAKVILDRYTYTLYAGDSALYRSSESANDLQDKLNHDLASVTNWMRANKLTLNIFKSKFMLVGSRRRLDAIQSIEIQGTDEHLERVHSFKHLGIIISEQLNWSDHFDYIQKKVSSRLGILRRIRHLLPIKTRKLVYNSLILPLLDYGDIQLCGETDVIKL